MKFGPGNPGNRNGRPRVRDSLADAVRHKWPPDRILGLAEELLTAEDADSDMRYRVMVFLADRGYGKAKETVEVQTDLTPEEYREELAIIAREHLASLSDEERERLLAPNPAPTDTIQ